MIKVKILQHTPDPQRTVALAGRLCYSSVGVEQLDDKMELEDVDKLVNKLAGLGHYSTFEHASFTFAVEGVSRVLTHQLVRHRIASYSQQSQRYVAERNFEYIIPPSIEENDTARKKFIYLMGGIKDIYNELCNLGIDKEDSRYVLPNATETKIAITMNARALLNFFELRCCMRAQWEIRQLAEKMRAEVRKVAPVIFAKAGPACESRRVCSEGEMTCGRLQALLQMDEAKKND